MVGISANGDESAPIDRAIESLNLLLLLNHDDDEEDDPEEVFEGSTGAPDRAPNNAQ